MFTGLIEGKGKITAKSPGGQGMVFGIEADFDLIDPREGESIAVNGVCLTAMTINGRRFQVDVSPETLSRSNLGRVGVGSVVNLERALKLSDRLGGHLVSGHVDGVATVLERRPLGDFVLFSFQIPSGLGRYIIEKGSITIDGISLTVNSCDERVFRVSIIPHTLEVTTLGGLKQGAMVNLEVDLIGKYVEKLLSVPTETGSRINPAFLAEHGFLK
ncbi:MAG: riboflavin synthase [Proteobacteria bacterium]|nr:riboflavin synthase [Pseudomonadota bacterium]MBU1688908.1 riboflavin synthase [Pseudomonadota bacterium]